MNAQWIIGVDGRRVGLQAAGEPGAFVPGVSKHIFPVAPP